MGKRDLDAQQATQAAFAVAIFQLCSRLITFLLNALVIRLTSPRVLGIAIVKLELLYNATVFLSREGIRLALLRYTSSGQDEQSWLKSLVHMSWLALPLSLPVLMLLGLAYGLSVPTDIAAAGLSWNYAIALVVYGLGAVVELAAEPCYMLFVHKKQVKLRIRAESIALIFRTVALLFLCILLSRHGGLSDLQMGLIAFPIGQVVYFSSLFVVLWIGFKQVAPVNTSIRSLLPYPEIEVDDAVVKQAHSMTTHVFLKYLLSQGDLWILSLLAPLRDQGVYAVVSNYGSLVCRILLQPIEESTLAFISRSISEEALGRVQGHVQEKRLDALKYLASILKFDILLSLGVLVYGTALARSLIGNILGRKWLDSEMPAALIAYCFLIPAMAFSGILEAFINATLNPSSMSHYRRAVMVATVVFVVLGAVLTRKFGSVGLIIGNIANFVMRATYGFWYLDRYSRNHLGEEFRPIFVRKVLVHRALLLYSGILSILFPLAKRLCDDLWYCVMVGISLPITFIAVYFYEPKVVASLGIVKAKQTSVKKES